MKKVMIFLGCLAVSFAAGAIGSIFTVQNIPVWYAALNKPPLNPPNWIFGPVWSLLYTFMAISLFLVIKKGFNDKGVKKAAGFWIYQLVLNTLWSIVFFGMKSPLWAIPIIVLLIDAILHTIVEFFKVSKTAAYLLIPYILWVSFAAYLNVGVFVLNR
jgi:benzodiazapine receptor